MVQINMLPWREQARQIKKKNFFVSLAGAIGFTLFIIFLFHVYYDDVIAYQSRRNAFLESQIGQKQLEINGLRAKKEELNVIQNKLQFIMGLRVKSYRAVRLLNEIIKVVPDTITLSKLERVDDAILIEGKAQSDLAITAFLKALSVSSIFDHPILTGISAGPTVQQGSEKYFKLEMEQK